jgi:hypothetical protein
MKASGFNPSRGTGGVLQRGGILVDPACKTGRSKPTATLTPDVAAQPLTRHRGLFRRSGRWLESNSQRDQLRTQSASDEDGTPIGGELAQPVEASTVRER